MVEPSNSIFQPMPQLGKLEYAQHKLAYWSAKLYTCWVLPQFAYLWFQGRCRRAVVYYVIQVGAVGHATYRNHQNAPMLARAQLTTWKANAQRLLQVMEQRKTGTIAGLPEALVDVLNEGHKRDINRLLASASCRGFAADGDVVHSFPDPLETPEPIWSELCAHWNMGEMNLANRLCSSEQAHLLRLVRALDQELSSIGDAPPVKDLALTRMRQFYFLGLTAFVWGGFVLRNAL